jgi:hypothetical protein
MAAQLRHWLPLVVVPAGQVPWHCATFNGLIVGCVAGQSA